MDFQFTAEAEELRARARRLADDFAVRAAEHDREASRGEPPWWTMRLDTRSCH